MLRQPKHIQKPPGVAPNCLRCSAARQNIELSGDDHAPVTRGRMRAQYPLPHGPPRRSRRRAPTSKVGRANVRPSPKTSTSGRGRGGRATKRDEKFVTSEATTTPDGGDSSAEEGARGRAPKPPAFWPRRAPAGDQAICVSSASDGEPGAGGGVRGMEGGGAPLLEQGPARASGGPNPHRYGVP